LHPCTAYAKFKSQNNSKPSWIIDGLELSIIYRAPFLAVFPWNNFDFSECLHAPFLAILESMGELRASGSIRNKSQYHYMILSGFLINGSNRKRITEHPNYCKHHYVS
jgi:hypothetical protein